MLKRVGVGLITGAILGVFCIIGASTRSTEALPVSYLFAFWYNRVVMGLLIALIPKQPFKVMMGLGLAAGLFVSFAFYSSTDFQDLMGFLAGIVYGAIIVTVLHFYDEKFKAS